MSISSSGLNHVLKQVRESNNEDIKINEEKANIYFDKRINKLKSQAEDIKKQANSIKTSAFTGFFLNIASVGLNLTVGLANEAISKVGKSLMKFGAELLSVANRFTQDMHQQKMKGLDYKKQQKQIDSEVYSKLSQEYSQTAQRARQRNQENKQVMNQVKRDFIDAQSAMIKK